MKNNWSSKRSEGYTLRWSLYHSNGRYLWLRVPANTFLYTILCPRATRHSTRGTLLCLWPTVAGAIADCQRKLTSIHTCDREW